jgi:hypothetical protein
MKSQNDKLWIGIPEYVTDQVGTGVIWYVEDSVEEPVRGSVWEEVWSQVYHQAHRLIKLDGVD